MFSFNFFPVLVAYGHARQIMLASSLQVNYWAHNKI